MRLPALLCLVAVALPPAPEDGERLIHEMHDRYAGKWYRTLTFVQKTTLENGTVETWYEAARIPGFLRIDIAPIDSSNAIVFRNDSLYVIRGAQVRASRPMVHPLMVLAFDVYADSAETTIRKLKELGFDLSKLREDTWQGRPVYVVGAAGGDSTANQFWVDKANLLFVRMIQTGPNGAVVETQFNRYQRLGDGWIAPEVLFFRNGKVITREEYGDIRADVVLPPELWEAAEYAPPAWVSRHP